MKPDNTCLNDILIERAQRDGLIPVDDFMRACLRHPQFGYYRTKDAILGRTGDFVTAPGVSQMFGEMIGMWCADMRARLGDPPAFVLAEVGAGDGTCLGDVLRATAKIPGFHPSAHVRTIDISPSLSAAARERLTPDVNACASFAQLSDISELWHDNTLAGLPVLLYGNEFLDALPVRQFVRSSAGWHERGIAYDKTDGWQFTYRSQQVTLPPAVQPDAMPEHTNNRQPIIEYAEEAHQWLADTASQIKQRGGALLMIDYGYVRPPFTSTLQAVRSHKKTHLFDSPGQDDMTALVDFTALHRILSNIDGAAVFDTATQADFLQHYGINVRAAALKSGKSLEERESIDSALHRLTHAEQMGVLFKVGGAAFPVPPA